MTTDDAVSPVAERRIPNKHQACLPPADFFALTETSRSRAVDLDDELLWLSREDGIRVGKDGIQLGGQRYWDERLEPFVATTQKKGRSPYVIWYDESALAAGRLLEITFGRIEPNRSRRALFRCRNMGDVRPDIDPAVVLERRASYTAALAARVSNAEQEYIERNAGGRAVERLLELEHERRQRHRETSKLANGGPAKPELDPQALRGQAADERNAALAAVGKADAEKASAHPKTGRRRKGDSARDSSSAPTRRGSKAKPSTAKKPRAPRKAVETGRGKSIAAGARAPRQSAPARRRKSSGFKSRAANGNIGKKVRQAWRSSNSTTKPRSGRTANCRTTGRRPTKADIYADIASYRRVPRPSTSTPFSPRS